MGLEVFLDEPELDLGDSIPCEIQEAMTTSFLHIAILSPRYAESTWCLAELSFMMKQIESGKQINSEKHIVPVFYNVDPRDIRWIKRAYAQAFSEHVAKGRYTSQKLEDWKSALQKVSYLKGPIVNSDNDEGMLKTIENYVHKRSKKISFVVAKHPVGLDETLKDFKRSVLESLEDVKIVGITGMGGCGKTTLAKEYYNEKMQSFYRCSFVCIDRDVPSKNLYEKQKKMFQDLGGSKDILFDNVEEGKAILAEHLRFVQVFIILDDVDHIDQLECLLPIKNNFRQGSVIVITSRDSHILTSWGIPSSSIYKMKELNFKYAMELFCLHAFEQPSPKEGFECLVKSFLKFCQGLPLSLKVLGGLVHGNPKGYWDSQLGKVSKSLPKDIKSILKVSIDALDEEQEEIFLDISCFFIGTEKDSAITVWDESKWSGECSLQTLVDKCLVDVDETNCLRMHDLLRDLGRDISKTRSPYRLWSPEQITHIIEKQGKRSVPIRGIKAQTDEFYEEFVELVRGSGREFKRKRGLKILDVENNSFTEELATLSEGLVCLRWANFPHTALPSGISLKKLRVLELCEASKLEEPWSETADPPLQLRVLKIIHAGNMLRFPRSIGFLKHLKEISFDSEGAPIEGLPEEFCRLQALERLRLIGCDKLKSLPSKFRDLTNLQNLQLSGCSGLMVPSEALVQLTSLQVLNIERCPGLTELVIQPECFSSSLCSLELLVLSQCVVSRISISPQCCPSLQYLSLSGNHDLVEIDSLPTSVKNVDVSRCSNLQSINLNCGLVKLQYLHVWECEELRKIRGLENCSSLEMLMVHTWGQLPVIESLKDMESLKRVSLTAACHKSAFEACLQTLNREKWPRECIICCRTAPGVEAIVKSFTFPGLTLVDSFNRYSWHYMDSYSWQYVFLGERSANAAAMICLVINSPVDDITLLQVTCVKPINAHTLLKGGKWVYIGVFTPSSLEGREVPFGLTRLSKGKLEDLVDTGILAMGEENTAVDAFHELVQHLGKAGDICEA
ncbi:hypothetical protein SUGI_0290450 [Cryptomeria japonica]|uniref:disease resistance protein Roq1 n=1 Tax=Cryptomeria japonica TaxID=3369 RepID=UPI002408A746|nr:disease resistance protein Roq1 [Cryptomeria japonica]GLJ16851.1 hypothetical protein SUGI_0290450 [Cryptomeria japonica]